MIQNKKMDLGNYDGIMNSRKCIQFLIQIRSLRWARHIVRMKEERVPEKCLEK